MCFCPQVFFRRFPAILADFSLIFQLDPGNPVNQVEKELLLAEKGRMVIMKLPFSSFIV